MNTRGAPRVNRSASRLYLSQSALESVLENPHDADADEITSSGSRIAITAAASSPARCAASNHRSATNVIRGSLITTTGESGSVVRYKVILSMQAVLSRAVKTSPASNLIEGSNH